MSDTILNVVGTAAGICSMISFVPQIVKIIRSRDASAVSLRMYMVTVTGFVLWTIYGVLLKSWPVAISNSVCLLLTATILSLRWRYGAGAPAPIDPPPGAFHGHGQSDRDQE